MKGKNNASVTAANAAANRIDDLRRRSRRCRGEERRDGGRGELHRCRDRGRRSTDCRARDRHQSHHQEESDERVVEAVGRDEERVRIAEPGEGECHTELICTAFGTQTPPEQEKPDTCEQIERKGGGSRGHHVVAGVHRRKSLTRTARTTGSWRGRRYCRSDTASERFIVESFAPKDPVGAPDTHLSDVDDRLGTRRDVDDMEQRHGDRRQCKPPCWDQGNQRLALRTGTKPLGQHADEDVKEPHRDRDDPRAIGPEAAAGPEAADEEGTERDQHDQVEVQPAKRPPRIDERREKQEAGRYPDHVASRRPQRGTPDLREPEEFEDTLRERL